MVGKSSLIARYTQDTFSPFTEKTTVIDSYSQKIDGHDVAVWDTAGQEIFKSMNRMYYRDVKACLLVHDCTRGNDF